MQVRMRPVGDLAGYGNNPRINENAVTPTLNSIKAFGFKYPILLDENDVIIDGHTRLEAAKRLGMEKVPTLKCSDLTPEQVKAFRLAVNKTAEIAQWDMGKLEIELGDLEIKLEGLDFTMSDFGFGDFDSFDESHIEGLLDDDEVGKSGANTGFAVTFIFDKEHEDEIKDFITQKGKKHITDMITEMALGEVGGDA